MWELDIMCHEYHNYVRDWPINALIIMDMTAIKLGPKYKNKYTSRKSRQIVRVTDQSIAKHHHFENCDLYKVLFDRWAESSQALPILHTVCTKPYKNDNFQNDGTWCT